MIKHSQRNKHFIPNDYKSVASGMEKQFVKHMIEQMDKTIGRSEKESSAEEYYKALLHNEFANKISQSDSLGIQDIILDQIYPRKLRNELSYKNFLGEQNTNQEKRPTPIKKTNPYDYVKINDINIGNK